MNQKTLVVGLMAINKYAYRRLYCRPLKHSIAPANLRMCTQGLRVQGLRMFVQLLVMAMVMAMIMVIAMTMVEVAVMAK